MSQPLAIVIEDEAYLATLYEDALRLVGFNVHVLNDGLKGLNYLATNPAPDLVILDVNLPSMSGKDIHSHIRSSDKYKGMTVIILTANTLVANQLSAAVTEHDHLHIKPIGVQALQQIARSVKAQVDDEPIEVGAETQPVPYLTDSFIADDTVPIPKMGPLVLSPDNQLIETDGVQVVEPQTAKREHRIILTPDDQSIPKED